MKTTKIGYFVFLLLASLFVFIIAHSIDTSGSAGIDADDGYADMTGVSLKEKIASVSHTWQSFPDELYSPEDFKKGDTESPVVFDIGKDSLKYHYGTHRMILETENYAQLALYFKSLDYSTAVYINGEKVDEIGKVGKTEDTSIARTRECMYAFSPQNGKTEVILQYSNFVHKDGGNPPTLFVSEPDNIYSYAESKTFTNAILIGCLLTAFLYYFCMFFVHHRRMIFLNFALCCLLFTLRYLPLQSIFPDISWNVSIRAEYVGMFAASMFLGIFVQNLFPTVLSTAFRYFVLIFYSIYLLIVIFTPTTFFTEIVLYVQIISLLIILYVCIKLIKPALSSFYGALGLFAMIAILVTMVNDSLGANSMPNLGVNDLMSIGIYIFVLSYMIILQIQASENEKMIMEITQNNIALEKVNRMKTEFVSNVSHELKTPLTVMSNKAQLSLKQIKMGDGDVETISRNLDTIIKETKNLSAMIEKMLDTARIEEDLNELSIAELDLNKLIGEIADDFDTSMDTNGSRIILKLKPGLPVVNGDDMKLKQALVNLLTNAIKNTKRGRITIETTGADDGSDFIKIKISDTGSGIEKEDLPYIFDRFYKVENGSHKGTGLGLFITKNIVESHGGSIEIQSEKNKGTTVSLSLPVIPD